MIVRNILISLLLSLCAINEVSTQSPTLDPLGRVTVTDKGIIYNVCPSYGLLVHIHNDTLAALLCKKLGLGNVGLARDIRVNPGQDNMRKGIYITKDLEITLGEPVTDGCHGMNKSLAITCIKDFQKIGFKGAIVGSFIRKTTSFENETVYQCGNQAELYRVAPQRTDYCYFTHICADQKEMRYQSCGCAGVNVIDSMCKGLVCSQKDNSSQSYKNIPSRRICDGYYHCLDKSDEKDCDYSEDHGYKECTPSRYTHNGFVPKLYFCDSYSDCKYGEDEIDCGFDFGMNCTMKETGELGWVDRKHICDGEAYCANSEDEDEERCKKRKETALTCLETGTLKETTVKEIDTCYYPRSYSTSTGSTDFLGCQGMLDQTNCSFTDVLYCEVKQHPNTRIRDRWLCNNWKVCDDGKDEICQTFNDNCKVHKYLVCDGKEDCTYGEDEKDCDEKTLPDVTCQRYLTREKAKILPLPKSWLCDGVRDCMNGVDEDENRWDCKSGIECPDLPGHYVKLESFCDDVESCNGSEAQLCTATRLSPEQFARKKGNKESDMKGQHVAENHMKFQFPCLPGLMKENSPSLPSRCVKDTNQEIKADSTHKAFKFWWNNCNSTTGWDSKSETLKEQLCTQYETSLRLQDLSKTDCISDRTIYNLLQSSIGSERLKKYVEFGDKNLADTAFVCANRKCLQQSHVCNLVDDCGDGSDEVDCLYSFYCSPGSGFPKTISKSKVCDGVLDCSDGSDECSQGCGNDKLLQSTALRYLAIFIGIASLLMNSYTIYQGCFMIYHAKSTTLKINHFFVILIGLGDWSMGLYLIIIASYDIYYDDQYCKLRYEWLTSKTCSFLGILSTFGSTLSIYTMVAVAIYRAASISGKVVQTKRMAMAVGAFLVAGSLMLSAVPLFPAARDYFSNGLWYKENPMFPKLADMNSHIQFVKTYKQIEGDTSTTEETWQALTSYIDNLFTSHEAPQGLHQTFYGNDAVCLFKYFVKRSDPQYSFTLMMTVLNCTSFLVITLCYAFVVYKMRKTTSVEGMVKDDRQRRNQRKIQIKVSLITVTDLVTWIPFCILSWAFTNGANISKEKMYQIAAVILLPLNSVMNPVIYNEFPYKLKNAIKALTSDSQRQPATASDNRKTKGKDKSSRTNFSDYRTETGQMTEASI